MSILSIHSVFSVDTHTQYTLCMLSIHSVYNHYEVYTYCILGYSVSTQYEVYTYCIQYTQCISLRFTSNQFESSSILTTPDQTFPVMTLLVRPLLITAYTTHNSQPSWSAGNYYPGRLSIQILDDCLNELISSSILYRTSLLPKSIYKLEEFIRCR